MKTKISDKWVATSKLLDLWDTVSQPEDLKRDKILFGDKLCGKSDSHRLYACTLNVSISLLEPKY